MMKSPTEKQLDLFTPAVAPVTETARTRAEALLKAQTNAARDRRRVLRFVVERGGATDDEMQRQLPPLEPGTMPGIAGNSQRPRRFELVQAGILVDSGAKRSTVSGTPAVVWKLTGELTTGSVLWLLGKLDGEAEAKRRNDKTKQKATERTEDHECRKPN